MHHNDDAPHNTAGRKRARPHIHNCGISAAIPKATLVTLLLWFVAFTTTHPSICIVKAFVLASDRPSHIISTNKQQQALATQSPILPPHYHYGDDQLHHYHDHHHHSHPDPRLYACATATLTPATLDTLVNVPTTDEGIPDFDLLSSPTGLTTLLLCSRDGDIRIPNEDQVLEWAGRYTSVDALRKHFGGNQNKLWGDLQASTARRLYKTLLPRALLELSKLAGPSLPPEHLAPLAYQARVAAKLYARERCTVPARIAATLFDGFRQWIKYGKFQGHGMTYDQLWEKYAEKILHETESSSSSVHHYHPASRSTTGEYHRDDDVDEEGCRPFDIDSDCDEDELAEQVCRKILERACVSNEGVDALVLTGRTAEQLQPEQRQLLERIRVQLEDDMYQLLLPGHDHHQKDNNNNNKSNTPVVEATLRSSTRDRLKKGKFRLVRRLAKQRRYWKLRQQKKLLAAAAAAVKEQDDRSNNNNKTTLSPCWTKSSWLSRKNKSSVTDKDEESDAETSSSTAAPSNHNDKELRP